MLTRIISGAICAIGAILIVVSGDAFMSAAVGIIVLMSLFEFFGATGVKNNSKFLFCLSVVFGAVLTFLTAYFKKLSYFNEMLVLYIVISFIYMVLNHGKVKFGDVALSVLGSLYITLFFNHIIMIRHLSHGRLYIWLPFVTAWLCDTCAYFTGMLFGKHKLIPKVSPKKTIEGAIGGVLGSVISVVIFALVCAKVANAQVSFVNAIILGAVCAVISQFGDLCASCIKREHDVKDFGNLIPGHGGILDRFDSVLMVSPIVYYLSLYMGIIG